MNTNGGWIVSGVEKARDRSAIDLRVDGSLKKMKDAASLFGAGGNCGPHAFMVTLTRLAACTLRDPSVDYAIMKEQ